MPRIPPASPQSWRQPAVLTAAALAIPVGFAQFAPAVALADVANAFGTADLDPDAVQQLALSGGVIGVGYAIIRLASLGSLWIASSADRFGRRAVLFATVIIGLVLTAVSGLSPSYWIFVFVFALGRPFLSATNAIVGVTAAEYTDTRNRAMAIVLVAAGYAVGTGLTVGTRLVAGDVLGFRGLFGLAIVPLVLLPLAARKLAETERFTRLPPEERQTRLGRIPRDRVGRLLLLALLTAGITFVTGPANTYVFGYGEEVAGLSTAQVSLAGFLGAPLGLAGLLIGRWGADHIGRRITAAVAMCAAALAGIFLYSGGGAAVLIGYPLALAGQAAFGPPAGALDAELFRTENRATVAGWLTFSGVLGGAGGLLVFGLLWDVVGFSTAAIVMFAPVAVLAWLYLLVPETRGRELDDDQPPSAPPPGRGGTADPGPPTPGATTPPSPMPPTPGATTPPSLAPGRVGTGGPCSGRCDRGGSWLPAEQGTERSAEMSADAAGLEHLSVPECLELLRTHPQRIGRVGIADDGRRPIILPVNYAMDDDAIVFRTAEGSKLAAAVRGAFVAFEVDDVDVAWQEGWSVLVRGQAHEVTDADEIARLDALPLHPWAAGSRDRFVRIRPDTVTGRRLQ